MLKPRKREPVVAIRFATVKDAQKIMDFYKYNAFFDLLCARSLEAWEQELSREANYFYMITLVDNEIKAAFRMRLLEDERSPGNRVAILDYFGVCGDGNYMYAVDALDKAKSFAKAHGCQTGILKGVRGRQLWDVYHLWPCSMEENITGDDYHTLLRLCGDFCSFVSFSYPVEHEVAERFKALEAYEIPVPRALFADNNGFCETLYERGMGDSITAYRRFFRLCPKMIELMITLADASSAWCAYSPGSADVEWCPEDPIFFREDGSAFFFDYAGEGLLLLYPRGGEDVSGILSLGKWQKGSPN